MNGAAIRLDVPDGGTLEVKIPPGIESGQVLRLRGKGAPGRGEGKPGDALIEVEVRPHRFFRREGDDIHLDVPVTLGEAVLGGKVTVPTPTGPVAMSIPANSNTGRVLRLKGKGVADRGDEYVTLKVVLPEGADSELGEFLKQWAPQHPYDPRRGMT